MKILRLYSDKKLPQSRNGIGWMQEKMKKNEAERYFKKAQEAADKAREEGKSDEDIIKASKKAVTKEAIKKNIVKTAALTAGAGGLTYLGAKCFKNVGSINYNGVKIPVSDSVRKGISGNAGKIALGVGLVSAGIHGKKHIYDKAVAARNGAEINTVDRLNKGNKKDDSIKK